MPWPRVTYPLTFTLCLLGLALAGGCQAGVGGGNQNASPDAGVDAGPTDPLGYGSAYTFEVATWNLENFPKHAQTPARTLDLLRRMQIDLLAVQEIGDASTFADLAADLGTHDLLLSPHEYSPGEYQKIGFLYRRDMLTLTGWELLFDGDWYAFPRPPLQAHFEAARPGGGTLSFIAIAVHLKAGFGSQEDSTRRREAIAKLKVHVDAILAAGAEHEIILLGDFNDQLDAPDQWNVFGELFADPDHYTALTLALAQAGDYTVLPWMGLIDHLWITAGLQNDYAGGHTVIAPLDLIDLGYPYVDAVSDHRPSIAVFPWYR